MQTLLTVVVLLAMVALGVLLIHRVNAQTAGRMATHHRYADWKRSMRERAHKRPHHDARPGSRTTGPPPPSDESDGL
ncbi:hypothetical protein SSP35_03_01880 [Streptomyces sp. NBRC 110611]|uniref:hypothetical protein n=1 Tax=Streptomyces sp. NBRC 110611 TaxID=1621259 RepID=UPI000857BEA4|nr:hypothetical protein [Streptomyces sp. NBRC 110611]GAU66540.1 hypothetical protein SSP35_03_01880 [Streptomyces sp. NBRC 110611]